MLRFDRKQNSVKQLSFNLKINTLKKKRSLHKPLSLLHQRVDRKSKKKHSLTVAKAKTILQKVSHDEKAERYVPEDRTR